MEYFKVQVDETAKDLGSKEERYRLFNTMVESFKTMEEVKTFIEERYHGKKPKAPIFIDTKEGESRKIESIYGFKNSDVPHDSKPWWQEDWVTVSRVQEEIVLP